MAPALAKKNSGNLFCRCMGTEFPHKNEQNC